MVKAGIPEDKWNIKQNLNCLDMPKQTLLLVFVLAGWRDGLYGHGWN